MDSSRLLLLIFTVMTTPECSGSAEPQCYRYDRERCNLSEGESLYFVPYAVESRHMDNLFTWFRTNMKNEIESITSSKTERVHHHGGALFILNASVTDSGFYTARRHKSSRLCSEYYVNVTVFEAEQVFNRRLLSGEKEDSDEKIMLMCPNPIKRTCEAWNGSFTWSKLPQSTPSLLKDVKLLEGRHDDQMWIEKATKADEGIYTCICTWTYYGKEYTSSGSRSQKVKGQSVHLAVKITPPGNKELLADEGAGITLRCSVFCGTNVADDCTASWHLDGLKADGIAGYSVTTEKLNESPSDKTTSTAILTIHTVSTKDFKTRFRCKGEGKFSTDSVYFSLKRRETITPLLVGGVCVLCFCVFAAVLVKYFAIDLVLFFRPCFPFSNRDGRRFDAYVVYQTQSPDKATEDALCQFVAKILPSVLEDKCGYRLFIHGRDDVPGEDRLELVEDRMKQSKRLMVILNPDSDQQSVSPQNSEIGGYDWQVGLHHALMQREMSVILIQLGDQGPQGYTHLPAGLQHLILRSAPIRWQHGSRGADAWNSRFWKRVRYLMPSTPAKRCPPSAVI